MIRLVSFYTVSGFIALVYEVLWMRLMAIQFGVSSFAVVITVAAFMFGLGLGAWRFSSQSIKPNQAIKLLAWIEFGLSVFAILLPTLVRLTTPFIDSAALRLSSDLWHLLIFIAALFLLTIPAYAMGAGFSLVLKYVGNQSKSLSLIYGLNTLGAVFGALWPLWALPTFGWVASLRIAAFIGLLISLGLAFFVPKKPQEEPSIKYRRPPSPLLFEYAFLGMLSLALEVAWTRLFGLIMLRTEYILALILAVFLLGISLGSVIVLRFKNIKWLAWFPWMAALGVTLSLLEWVPVSAYLESAQFGGFLEALMVDGMLLLLMTLPVSVVLGAWLPLLNEKYQNSGQWLYSVNAFGGGVGALLTGLVCIPLIGTTKTLGLIAFFFILFAVRRVNKQFWFLIPVLGALLFWVSTMPSTARLLPQEMGHSQDLYHYEDAIAMTEVVQQANGQRYLLTDLQRRDASSDPTAVFTQENQVRFPLLFHGNAHQLLLLGLGTGISDQGSAEFNGLSRTAVELSYGAIEAASKWFTPVNQPTLKQTLIVEDDARHYLSSNHHQYDVIVGDLFHPDLAGVSSLLSVQQFQRIRQHLSRHGVFVQWVALNQFDLSSLAVVFNTFKKVFPDGVLFLDGMHLAMLGTAEDRIDAEGLLTLSADREKDFENDPPFTWMGRYCGKIPSSGKVVQDEWSPVIEFSLPKLHYTRESALPAVLKFVLANRPSLKEAETELGLAKKHTDSFERSYVATDFLMRSWLATFSGNDSEAQHLISLAYQANPRDRWIQYALSDELFNNRKALFSQGMNEQEVLTKILSINPNHVEALRSLWHLQQINKDPQMNSSLNRLLKLSPLDLEANSAKNGVLSQPSTSKY